MTDSKKIKEGLGDMAHLAEKDHEVQMARAELYKIAKYAIKLHEIMKGLDPATDLEAWVQAKITKSAEFLDSVYHHLDYQTVAALQKQQAIESVRAARSAGGDAYKDAMKAKLGEAKKTKSPAARNPAAAAMKSNGKAFGKAGAIPDKKKSASKKAARSKVPMETAKKK